MLNELPTPLLTEKSGAKLLCVSPAALRRWRRENRGPAYLRLERCVRYRIEDLRAYIGACGAAVSATAAGEPGKVRE